MMNFFHKRNASRVLLSLSALWCIVGFQGKSHAHAEHGAGEPVPQIAKGTKLPNGISLEVVKSNAYQFSLATDGNQKVEVIGEEGSAFLRIEKSKVFANLSSPSWFRAQQPGGGAIPPSLKDGGAYKKLAPNWKEVSEHSGYGWYDPRLLQEDTQKFKLKLNINGKVREIPVVRVAAPGFQGYWTSTITKEPALDELIVLMPGLSSGAISVQRDFKAKQNYEILDDRQLPFIQLKADGCWVNVEHPWFEKSGLFVKKSEAVSSKGWARASSSGLITFQDPRLHVKDGEPKKPRQWKIAIRVIGTEKVDTVEGDTKWVAKK
ncbi:MAG: hypothetical protein QE278_03810 [Limnobacter sp.]|nr:hypothetical protein [Limnobacter sp.]